MSYWYFRGVVHFYGADTLQWSGTSLLWHFRELACKGDYQLWRVSTKFGDFSLFIGRKGHLFVSVFIFMFLVLIRSPQAYVGCVTRRKERFRGCIDLSSYMSWPSVGGVIFGEFDLFGSVCFHGIEKSGNVVFSGFALDRAMFLGYYCLSFGGLRVSCFSLWMIDQPV